MSGELNQTAVMVVDCQSTGASPTHGRVIELGWAALDPTLATRMGSVADVEVTGRLIALPAGEYVPGVVSRLTGIRTRDLADASEPWEAWCELRSAAQEIAVAAHAPCAPTVIHYARFENAFLTELDKSDDAPFPLDVVCTHEIARRLLPDLPRRGLRALAGYFGYTAPQLRRSSEHVAATAFVWGHLVRTLATESNVHTWAELGEWLRTKTARRPKKRSYPMDRKKRLALPDAPGVYRMLRTNGDVLYVGKASSLKKRVNSYFGKQRKVSERHLEMLTQARELHITVVATPLEAAVLETDEIKRLNPPYNRVLLDKRNVVFDSLPGENLLLGPFPYRSTLVPLTAIAAAWQSDTQSLPEHTAAQALGIPRQWAPDAGTFLGGLALFRERYAINETRRRERALLRLATPLWLLRLAEEKDQEEEDPATEWTVDLVFEKLEEVVRRVGHLTRRARWLGRLSESSVAWKEPGASAWRVVNITHGQIRSARDHRSHAALPIAPGASRSFAQRQQVFNLATYDRLRTLTTELRRVLSDGGEAAVRFGARRPVESDALRRALKMF